MNAQEILKYAKKIDIRLSARGSKLIVDAPKGQLTDSLKSELKAKKPALLKLLSKSSQPNKAIIYTAVVDGKELTLIDISSKPLDEFRKGVISRFGLDKVGIITRC
jgi:hypothetical protein